MYTFNNRSEKSKDINAIDTKKEPLGSFKIDSLQYR